MDPMDLIRAIAALAVTLGLLAGAALLARRMGLMQGVGAGRPDARLKLVDQLWLDQGRTRAVVLRADGVEHLIVVGQHGATVVSSVPAAHSPLPTPTDPEPTARQPSEPKRPESAHSPAP